MGLLAALPVGTKTVICLGRAPKKQDAANKSAGERYREQDCAEFATVAWL
jgi:hypothetical protein